MRIRKRAITSITRVELGEAANRACRRLSRAAARNIVDALFEEIQDALAYDGSVELRGFGRFKARNKAPRPGRNPKTGADATVSARCVVSFKASDSLLRRINERPASGAADPTPSDDSRGGRAAVETRAPELLSV